MAPTPNPGLTWILSSNLRHIGIHMVGRLGNNFRRCIQFRLSTIFWAMTAFALLMVTASQTYLWFKSIPLTNAIIDFNSRKIGSIVPFTITPLSEEEIDIAVESLLSKGIDNGIADRFVSRDEVENIFKNVVRTRRLPRNAIIDLYSDNDGYTISLRLITSSTSDFIVVLRKVEYLALEAPL